MPPSTCRKRLTDSTSQLEDHAPSNNSNGKVYHAVPVDVTPHHTVVTVVPDAPRPEPKDPVSVGQVVLDHLNLVEEYVEKTVPNSCWPGLGFDLDPVKIPSIERLREYALNLDNVANPACSRQMFDQLLGRAGQVDVEYPLPTFLAPLAPYFPGRPVVTSLTFPQDHHFHPTWGDEWYYVCAKVPILDADGNFGEAAFLSSIQRKRAIGLTTQQKYAWTDAQSTILSNVCTVTVRFKDFWGNVTRTVYARGSLNTHWGAVEPNVSSFSAPGQPFGISAGSGDNVATFTSTQPSTSPEILPATFSVNNKVDGKVNIKTDLTFSSAAGVDPNQGWFLQGTPSLTTSASPIGAPGDGLTLPPAAGLYYSWPQTVVTGTTLVVNDETFVIVGPGNGWVDHQSLSNTLFNFDLVNATTNPFPIQPIPFRQDAGPVNGWTWNFCNFEDGTSWTGAVFEEAPPVLASPTLVPYGYSVTLGSDGKYVGAYTVGTAVLNPATWVTAPAGRPITTEATPFVSQFQVANERQFMEQGNSTLITTATGWTDPYGNTLRCDFNNADFTGVAEAPADWIQPTKLFNNRGWGFLETVSFERKYACQIRMMHYLDNSTYPEEGPLVEEVRKRSVVKNCCGCFTRLLYRIYRCLSFSRPDHEARSALL